MPEKIEDYGFLQKPGALDVAALQWLYGINEEAAGNDNVYRLPLENEEGTGWESIWDTGGIDRIDGSRSKKPVRIDLRNATLAQSESAGGYVSRVKVSSVDSPSPTTGMVRARLNHGRLCH